MSTLLSPNHLIETFGTLGLIAVVFAESGLLIGFGHALSDAEIITRPSSLLYVQALKFLQTRATPPSARQAVRKRQIRRATSGRNR